MVSRQKLKKKFEFSSFIDDARVYAALIPKSDGHKRTAISRLYYGSFHVSLSFLRAKNFYRALSVHSVHENVHRSLMLCGHNKVATYLEQLKRFRAQADYRNDMIQINEKLELSFRLAEQVIMALKK